MMNPYMSSYGVMNPYMGGYMGGYGGNSPNLHRMYANTGGLSGGLHHTTSPSSNAAMFDTYGDEMYDQYENDDGDSDEDEQIPGLSSNFDENGEQHIHIYHRHPISPMMGMPPPMHMSPFMPPPPMPI